MTKRGIKRESSAIDPMFFIPDGVDELDYVGDEATIAVPEEEEDEDFSEVLDDTEIEEFEDDVDYGDAPDTPQILGIVLPQIIRVDDTGKEVVDVVFEVDDVPGALNYEFRVTTI